MSQTLARVQPVTEPLYLSTSGLLKRFAISRTWLWRQDLKPPIKNQIGGKLLWHSLLFEDWLANQGDPVAQQRAIENYLAGLPSNQPRCVGRPKK